MAAVNFGHKVYHISRVSVGKLKNLVKWIKLKIKLNFWSSWLFGQKSK